MEATGIQLDDEEVVNKEVEDVEEEEGDLEEDTGEDPQGAGDSYEVFNEGIKVHSRTDLFNKDFTLSDLTSRERYFVREQLRMIDIISKYIQDESQRGRLEKVMMIDVHSLIILSRAKNGRLIKGLLEFITGEKQEEVKSMKDLSLWDKFWGKRKPPGE